MLYSYYYKRLTTCLVYLHCFLGFLDFWWTGGDQRSPAEGSAPQSAPH